MADETVDIGLPSRCPSWKALQVTAPGRTGRADQTPGEGAATMGTTTAYGALPVRRDGVFAWSDGAADRVVDRVVDSSRGRFDLEPFWPSRQPHLFDQTCPGSPGASRPTAR